MPYELGHCTEAELPELIELANRVFRGAGSGDMGREYPLVFDPGNLPWLRVARHDGRPVAHVGVCLRDVSLLGARLRVAGIGAVCTDPEHRGQGLASRLMAEAQRLAREDGAALMLISGTRGLYRRLGFVQPTCFRWSAFPAGPLPAGYRAEIVGPERLEAVVALHQRESIRFFRPREDWTRLLAAGMLMNRPADLHLVCRCDRPVAYAAIRRPTGPEGTASAAEIAGCREALASVLPALAGRYGVARAEAAIQPGDAAWEGAAAARGWHSAPLEFPGTVGVLDLPRLLDAARPLLAERGAEGLILEPLPGEGLRVAAKGRAAEVRGMSAATRLLFDPVPAEELPAELQQTCNRVFPLPLPWYGYNYV